MLIPLLVTFLYVGSWQKKGVDYLFAIFPAWIVLFSMWLDQVWGKLEKQKLLRNTLIVLVFLPSLLMSVHQNILALNMDTREKATEWLKNNLAGNTKICYDHYTFDLGLFDVHRYTEYGASSGQLPEEIKRRLLPYQKHPRNISNVPVVILHQSPIHDGDNLYENQMSGYRRKSVEELQAEDVTYLVTNSWYYGPYLECDRERFSPVMKEKITEVRNFIVM